MNAMTDETNLPTPRWHKGMSSPNPKGRPKMPKTVKVVRALARQHTSQMIEVLSRVALNPKSPPAARVQAAESLISRGWGRAPSGDLEGAEALVIKVIKFAGTFDDDIRVIEHDNGQADDS
jgi:hypothetical protein